MKTKTLVLFDFDKTLYSKDSLSEFTKYYKGNSFFYTGIITLLPFLLMMKLGLLSNEKTKIKYLSHFFKDEDYTVFSQKAALFAKTKIKKNVNPKIFSAMLHHTHSNHDIYIVTASFSEWIEPWCEKYNIKVIGTKLEIVNNKITGELNSKNCNGKEKVNRIEEIIKIENYNQIFVYGTGKGDTEMLKLAKQTLPKINTQNQKIKEII